MKQIKLTFLLIVLMSMVGAKAFAHDIEVKNTDGVTIYYIWKNNKTELSVSYRSTNSDSYSYEYTGRVIIPESVTYNGNTYSVTSIGDSAFSGCSGLTSITIPNSVTYIGENAFYNCYGLTSITIPNSVTSIGSSAFKNCSGLTSITIPNSVTSIGDSAFSGCSGLTSITIPNSVTYIGDSAFSRCGGLTSITIPNSLTSIRYYAFFGCSGLTSITIPNSVTYIGSSAFMGCTGLKSITIPNSVTSIGSSAFEGCSSLTSVTIGNSVTSIESYAFSGCTAMTRLISHAITPPTCGSQALDDINKWNCTLSVPTGSIPAYQQANQWKKFLFINDDVSGISKLTNSIATPNHIYDLNGQKRQNTIPGLNIIRMSDGTTKKVILK